MPAMIKTVGSTTIQPRQRLSCHCGADVLALDLPDGIVDPRQSGYKVGCLEGVNPFDLGPVPTNDGVKHPADRR